MLAAEHEHLHRLPRLPHTVCFGQTRKVNWQSTISVGGAIYSVPHELVDERVWVRIDRTELIVVHVDGPTGTGFSRSQEAPFVAIARPGVRRGLEHEPMLCALNGRSHRLFWMRSAWCCHDCRQKIESCCDGAAAQA